MSTYYFVGSGIASLAGAAYLIRDGDVASRDIVIFEESSEFGGALNAHGDPATGYFMSGSRMFEDKYNCTFDLMSSIPSTSDAAISVTQETKLAASQTPWYDTARLVDRNHAIINAHPPGFNERDGIDLLALMVSAETSLDGKRITDYFADHFFQTNFRFEWCTLFAFQRWHSAIELKRYLVRFIHHFSTIDTQAGVYRTRYNQYDSMAVPLVNWLQDRGVQIRFEATVKNLGFIAGGPHITVDSIECAQSGVCETIPVGTQDRVFVTNGFNDRR